MDSPQGPERLVSVKEAAHFLSLSPRTVRDKAQIGEIPSVKIGGARRYRLSALAAWVAEQNPSPEGAAA
jgi:excisionase family DNA binding protein